MIVVVDTGLGNVGSVVNMCARLGVRVKPSGSEEDVRVASVLILPGIGAFDAGMKRLRDLNLVDALTTRVMSGRVPVLGICLGMQLMTRGSEEGVEQGLGWVPASTRSIRNIVPASPARLRLPHIGWNYVRAARDHPLTRNFDPETRFYFVHSYAVVCDDPNDLLVTTNCEGLELTAGFARGNVIGTQYHPEKSHKFGMQMFRDFFAWTEGRR